MSKYQNWAPQITGEFIGLFLGKQIGKGIARTVYGSNDGDRDFVIKVLPAYWTIPAKPLIFNGRVFTAKSNKRAVFRHFPPPSKLLRGFLNV